MHQGSAIFAVDCATKFFRSIYIAGWFHKPGADLASVRLRCPGLVSQQAEVGLEHGGVSTLGPKKGFMLQAFLSENKFPENAIIEFQARRDRITVPLMDLVRERTDNDMSESVERRFVAHLKKMDGRPKLLDIGGRDRSALDRSKQFPYADVTVVDILPGKNVDVVGDAHELSRLFEPESFDAVYSVSVFEHLLMPWKAVIEINKILKPGGVGLIFTHQTIGLHDSPWDFWRYSAYTWDGLLNRHTGFEIEERSQSMLNFILPMLYRDSAKDSEKAAGYEASVVLFRKIGPTELRWDVGLNSIIDTLYPSSDTQEGVAVEPMPAL